MPGTSKSASPTRTASEPVAFEDALKKLESIVETMETGELPLEKLIAHYEEGVRLSQQCQGRLTEAELKIEELEKNSAGEIGLRTLSPPAVGDE